MSDLDYIRKRRKQLEEEKKKNNTKTSTKTSTKSPVSSDLEYIRKQRESLSTTGKLDLNYSPSPIKTTSSNSTKTSEISPVKSFSISANEDYKASEETEKAYKYKDFRTIKDYDDEISRITGLITEEKAKIDKELENKGDGKWWSKNKSLGENLYALFIDPKGGQGRYEDSETLQKLYDEQAELAKAKQNLQYEQNSKDMSTADKFGWTMAGNLDTARRGMEATISKILGQEYNEGPTVEERLSAKASEDAKGLEKVGLDVTGSVARMLPNIILGGGVGAASGSAKIGETVSTIAGFANFGGGAYNQAKEEGYSEEKATIYGATIGAMEMALTKAMGAMSGVYGKTAMGEATQSVVDNVMSKVVSNTFVRQSLTSFVTEGSEEFLQEYIDNIARDTILDEKGFLKSTWENVTDTKVLEDALYSALIGGITGATMDAPQNIDAATQEKQVIKKVEEEVGRELTNEEKNIIKKELETLREQQQENVEQEETIEQNNVMSPIGTQEKETNSLVELPSNTLNTVKEQNTTQEVNEEQEVEEDEDILKENQEQKNINKEWTEKYSEQDRVNRPLAVEQAKKTGNNTMVGYTPILSNHKLYSKGSLSWVNPEGKVDSKVISETEIEDFLSKNHIDKLEDGINAFENGLENKLSETKTKQEIDDDAEYIKQRQQEQFEIIQKNNPMTDDYHVGIRSADEIKDFADAMEDEESFFWGDFSKEDAVKALQKGRVTVYSSKPIRQGTFVSTSRNQAQDYAGNGKVYSKNITLEEVAWINGDEGQVASTNNLSNVEGFEAKPKPEWIKSRKGVIDHQFKWQESMNEGKKAGDNHYVTDKDVHDLIEASLEMGGYEPLKKGEFEKLLKEKKAPTRSEKTLDVQRELTPIKEATKELKKATKELKQAQKDIEKTMALTKEQYQEYDKMYQESLEQIKEMLPPVRNNLTQEESAELDSLENLPFDATEEMQERMDILREQEASDFNLNEEFGDRSIPVESPLYNRDIDEVGKRGVKAYQYEHPEFKQFFQPEAKNMLYDLKNSIKGERILIGDTSQFGNPNDQQWIGIKRHTTEDIEYLRDNYNYTTEDLEKGLNAIIKDEGAENIAVAKRIEFMLDERLRNGYTDVDGYEIPPSQEYLDFLTANNWTDYYNNISPSDTAPYVEESVSPAKEEVKPNKEAFVKEVEKTSKEVEKKLGYIPKDPRKAEAYEYDEEVAEILTEEPQTPKDKKKKVWAWIKANILDKGMVFEDLAIKKKNRNLQAKWDFTLTSEARAQYIIGNGHFNSKGKQTSKSLNAIMEEVNKTGKTKTFYQYMYHYLNIDRMSLANRFEGMENKPVFGERVSADYSRKMVRAIEAKYPKFKEFAKDVYRYVNADRAELVKKGVISKETAELWQEMYPHYVPIRRVGHQGAAINVALDTNRTGINAPIKKATGGSSDILPLFDTMAQRTIQTQRATAKNSFGIELKNTLKAKSIKSNTNLDEVIDSVDNQEGLLQKGENGSSPTFTVFENGNRVTYEITEEMYEALKPISDSSILSKTIKPLNTASSIHRGLLTQYNIFFALKNGIKDIQDVLINSQHAAKTYAKVPEAYAQLIGKGHFYNEYMRNGGEHNSYFDSQDMNFDTQRKGISKVLDFWPIKKIAQLNDFIETVPRLAEYIASRETGKSIEESMLDAARVTTNFKAGGAVTKFANRNGATFLNASVQGALQQVRNVREANMNGLKGWAGLATKFTMAGLPAILLNALLWEDDEDYEELSDYVKQSYYIVGKYGDGQFIRIPKGRTTAVIQDAIEQVSNAATGNDEVDMASFLQLVATNLAPSNPIENNIFSPIIQVATNKTWYGDDLVPQRLQDLPANEQFDETTDTFSRWLGEKTNISPIKINYLLNQYSGVVGDVVMPMITPKATQDNDNPLLAPLADIFTVDSVMKNQNVTDFYSTSEKLTKGAKSKNATDDDVLKNKFINSIKTELNDLYKEKREIQSDETLSKSEKYEKVKEVQKQINALAEAGVNNYEDLQVTENYATVSDRSYRKNIKGEWVPLKQEELEEIEELGMTMSERNEYFSAKNEISRIINDYKDDKEDINDSYDIYDEDSDELKEKVDTLSSEKKANIIKTIQYTGLNDAQQAYLYKKYYSTDTIDHVVNANIGVSNYFDYIQQEFTADYNSKGNAIPNTRKNKVIAYVNEYELDIPQKAILIKATNTFKFNDYNYEIVEYVANLNISREEKVKMLKDLDMKVYSDGTVEWE